MCIGLICKKKCRQISGEGPDPMTSLPHTVYVSDYGYDSRDITSLFNTIIAYIFYTVVLNSIAEGLYLSKKKKKNQTILVLCSTVNVSGCYIFCREREGEGKTLL